MRRRLHEVLVHRADAALAAGVGFEVDGAVAADAISEWLGLAAMLSPGIGESSVHLHATEDGLGSEGSGSSRARRSRMSTRRPTPRCEDPPPTCC